MPADRPSREYRVEHEAGTGLPLLVPVTDPPPAAATSRSAPPRRGGAQSWAVVIVAVLGAGGAPELWRSLRGDAQAAATRELAGQVAELSGHVARLETALRDSDARLVRLQATVEAREQARLEQLQLARSHLRQPPTPDVQGALRVLDE